MENQDENQNISLAVINTKLEYVLENLKTNSTENKYEHKEIIEKLRIAKVDLKQKVDNHCIRIREAEKNLALLKEENNNAITRDKFDILIKSNQGEIKDHRVKITEIEKKLVEFEPVKQAYDKIAALAIGFFITIGIFAISVFYYFKNRFGG